MSKYKTFLYAACLTLLFMAASMLVKGHGEALYCTLEPNNASEQYEQKYQIQRGFPLWFYKEKVPTGCVFQTHDITMNLKTTEDSVASASDSGARYNILGLAADSAVFSLLSVCIVMGGKKLRGKK